MKDDLNVTEFDWLRQIAEANPQLIPSAIADRLRKLGYIEQRSTGHHVTPKGRKRLAKGSPAA